MYYTYIYLEVGNSKTKVPSNYCSGKGAFLAPLTISVCMCTLVISVCVNCLFIEIAPRALQMLGKHSTSHVCGPHCTF